VCVRKRHEDGKVVNELVALPADGGSPPVVLASGRDFYASPRCSPDGRRLAWLEWDHPNMPWNATDLQVAELDAGGAVLGDPATVAGGPGESVFQPEWSPDGMLHFVSDRSGWWNLYRLAPETGGGRVQPLAPMEEEVGAAQWRFGMSRYAFLPGGRVAMVHGRGPLQRLGVLAPDGTLTDLDLPFTSFSPPRLRAVGDRLACVAGSATRPAAVVVVDPAGGSFEVLRRGRDQTPDLGYLRGGSAGGWTTLCALTFRDDFAAGASYYGVGDAAALARDTHKFESRYLDRLIGPWPAAAELYRQRSPIHATDRLSCPVILLQGMEDEVVPPAQAEAMAAALDAKRIPHAYVAFPGEQHGFRQADHIRRAIEAEVYFYSRMFGFELADPVDPVPIAHL
jgi:dipeptidyl aminopeptidase/acylaminoacyl peptidase